MRRFGGLLLSALVLVACSANADPNDTVGSLGVRAPAGWGCLPTAGSTHFLIGWEDLTNKGGPVTINAVSLTDPHDLTLVKTTLVSMTDLHTKNLVGTWGSWTPRASSLNDPPPGGGPTVGEMLDAQVPAVGYTIAAGEHVSLVEYIETDGGWTGPVRVNYTDANGDTHLWVGGSTWSIKHGSVHACAK